MIYVLLQDGPGGQLAGGTAYPNEAMAIGAAVASLLPPTQVPEAVEVQRVALGMGNQVRVSYQVSPATRRDLYVVGLTVSNGDPDVEPF